MPQRSFLPEQKNVLEINKQGYISEVSSSTVRCYEKDGPDLWSRPLKRGLKSEEEALSIWTESLPTQEQVVHRLARECLRVSERGSERTKGQNVEGLGAVGVIL